MELTSRQRKILEKAAHPLSAAVLVGGAGVTPGLCSQVSAALKTHEIIKVKFNEFKDEKIPLAEKIAQSTDSTLVRITGNVAVFYRPAEEPKDRVIRL